MKNETLNIIQVRFLSPRNKFIYKKESQMIKTQMSLYFSSSSWDTKSQWNNFYRVLKARDFEPKFYAKFHTKGNKSSLKCENK